jgi:hypothetical protein
VTEIVPELIAEVQQRVDARRSAFDAELKRMEENALAYIDETGLRIADLN